METCSSYETLFRIQQQSISVLTHSTALLCSGSFFTDSSLPNNEITESLRMALTSAGVEASVRACAIICSAICACGSFLDDISWPATVKTSARAWKICKQSFKVSEVSSTFEHLLPHSDQLIALRGDVENFGAQRVNNRMVVSRVLTIKY